MGKPSFRVFHLCHCDVLRGNTVRCALAPLQLEAAPPFALFEGWAPRTMPSGDFSDPQLSLPGLVYQDRAMSAFRVVAKTAPCPLLRCDHESTLYRIAMHVTQFFDPLLFGEHHEVVEAMLPDMSLLQSSGAVQVALSR